MNKQDNEIYESCQMIADSINHATKVLNPLELCFFIVGLEACLPTHTFRDYIKINLQPEEKKDKEYCDLCKACQCGGKS